MEFQNFAKRTQRKEILLLVTLFSLCSPTTALRRRLDVHHVVSVHKAAPTSPGSVGRLCRWGHDQTAPPRRGELDWLIEAIQTARRAALACQSVRAGSFSPAGDLPRFTSVVWVRYVVSHPGRATVSQSGCNI